MSHSGEDKYSRRLFFINGFAAKKERLLFRCPVVFRSFDAAMRYWQDAVGEMPAWVERAELVCPRDKLKQQVYVRPKWHQKIVEQKYTPKKAVVTPRVKAIRPHKNQFRAYTQEQERLRQERKKLREEREMGRRVKLEVVR